MRRRQLAAARTALSKYSASARRAAAPSPWKVGPRLRRAGERGPIAITLAPADAVARSGLRLAAHGLTPAQRRIAELVLQGRSTRQMVAELRIGEHTVQDHLKAVFDKLGVGSRRELVAALLR